MALVRWEKGQNAGVLANLINLEFPSSHPLEVQISDNFESVEYDDTDLTAQEIIDIEALLNLNGFTKQ